MAWHDGELGNAESALVAEHVRGCDGCRDEVESWQRAGAALVEVIDAGIGEVEPLYALRSIRNRIDDASGRASFGRLADWWRDLWAFNRRHLELLESYVEAKLRERHEDEDQGWANTSLVSRLPAWMKSAKNREEVLKGLARLRELGMIKA